METNKDILEKHFNLKDIAELWLKYYPEDIFINEPKEVIVIRENFKILLEKLVCENIEEFNNRGEKID